MNPPNPVDQAERRRYFEHTTAYYDQRFGVASDGQPNREESQRLAVIQSLLERTIARLGRRQDLTILDVGCGRGWLSGHLSRYGQVTGVDLAAEAVARASEDYPHVRFLTADVADEALERELGREAFDIVVCSEVIEHVLDQDRCLQNLLLVMKPRNSALILTTPNGRWKKHFFHGPRKEWAQPYELWLTRRQLEQKVGSRFDTVSSGTFGSAWIAEIRSFGLIDAMGHPAIVRFTRAARVEGSYHRLLDAVGCGLYIYLLGTR